VARSRARERQLPIAVSGGRHVMGGQQFCSGVYFPLAEAVALADALPNVRLTVTRTLDHTRPTASLTRLRDFAAFGRFVVRGLAAAG
jgi:hypothetical protein